MKRNRGRNRRSGGQNPNRHYESTGPDVKIRGSAQQIYEKYQQYARDAQSAGDRVAAESYLQHAEHYFRIMAATMPRPPVVDNDLDGDDDLDTDNEADDGDDADTPPSPQRRERDTRENREGGGRDGNRNNRNNRRGRDRSERSDDKPAAVEAMEVVDEGAEQPVEIGSGGGADASGEDGEAKPRSRSRGRAPYRKRESREDDGGEDSAGVMAIVSRGASRRDKEESADAGESVAD